MKYSDSKLLFVYNAETGFFNKLTDMVHKIVSPDTYACSLCALTYGKFTMFEDWAEYLQSLPLKVEFIYKNEWRHKEVYDKYPLVALRQNGSITLLLKAEELNSMKSLAELKGSLNEALQLKV
ncbi:hypothetical protein [Pontibacter rugosus]|uniref:GTPase n=1 Tax=Pontibacter rugosus TaxID=1745966 RepID=A0ABW3SKP7_9BACT